MPIVIGAKPESNFTDPIGLLTDCHRRIERFLSILVKLGANAGTLDQERRTALDTALKYFREAAPKHTADEEETLFPRLRSLDRPEVAGVLQKVESLETDHARADRAHAEIDALGQQWLRAGTLEAPGAERFRALAAELEELYRNHIAIEEREVFPLAAVSLAKPERDAMGTEMAARRGVRQG